MPVGDVNSSERGSGARYNDGKDPLHLVPARFWLDTLILEDWGLRVLKHVDYLQVLDREAAFPEVIEKYKAYREQDLTLAAKVFEYGTKKYAAWNWAKGMNWSIPVGCIIRHLRAFSGGEELDPESGLPHRGHVMCNVIMLDWFIEHYPEGDDLAIPNA